MFFSPIWKYYFLHLPFPAIEGLNLKGGSMSDDLTKAVIKALEKNHRNGPITARNLANIYKSIIEGNRNMTADQIASLINEADLKSDQDDDAGDE